GVLIVCSSITGAIRYASHRKQQKPDKQFGTALQEYLDSARSGTLNIEILNSLISSIEVIEKDNPQKSINLNISTAQFGDLINCIFDYTKRLAEANNINAQTINRPKYFKKKTTDDLKYYLNMQKQIFEQASLERQKHP
ncbi:MAG: hypothetical protein K2I03_13210, partial [Lachnospiraceae bacterium]|nr:hypothetical protein [Lachnospiraceae bacterium]